LQVRRELVGVRGTGASLLQTGDSPHVAALVHRREVRPSVEMEEGGLGLHSSQVRWRGRRGSGEDDIWRWMSLPMAKVP